MSAFPLAVRQFAAGACLLVLVSAGATAASSRLDHARGQAALAAAGSRSAAAQTSRSGTVLPVDSVFCPGVRVPPPSRAKLPPPPPAPEAAPDVLFLLNGVPLSRASAELSETRGRSCAPPKVYGADLDDAGHALRTFALNPFPLEKNYSLWLPNYPPFQKVRLRGTWARVETVLPDRAMKGVSSPQQRSVRWIENGLLYTWESTGLSTAAAIAAINGLEPDAASPGLLVPKGPLMDVVTVQRPPIDYFFWYVNYHPGSRSDRLALSVVDHWGGTGPPLMEAPPDTLRLVRIDGREVVLGWDDFEVSECDSVGLIQVPTDIASWTDGYGRQFTLTGHITAARLRSLLRELAQVPPSDPRITALLNPGRPPIEDCIKGRPFP